MPHTRDFNAKPTCFEGSEYGSDFEAAAGGGQERVRGGAEVKMTKTID